MLIDERDESEVRTDTAGRFTLHDVATGTRQVEVLSIGMVPVVAAVDVIPGDTASLVLTARRVTTLDVVRVTASKRAQAIVDGFADRRKLGGGYFMELARSTRTATWARCSATCPV